jgi:hypothetical protein
VFFSSDHAFGAGILSSASESWENHSYFHPAILDGGLHPLAGVAPKQSGQTRLPFQVAETKLVYRLTSTHWFVDAGLETDKLQKAHLMSGGGVHAILNGFEVKALKELGSRCERSTHHSPYFVVFVDVLSKQGRTQIQQHSNVIRKAGIRLSRSISFLCASVCSANGGTSVMTHLVGMGSRKSEHPSVADHLGSAFNPASSKLYIARLG